MRTKLVTIVAILWVATVGAVTVAFYASRPYFMNVMGHRRYFQWDGWWASVGGLTLAALAAIAIIVVLTRKAD
jgi:hypothetical protein